MRVILPAAITIFILLQISFMSQVYGEDVEKELSIGERFHYETSLTWRGVIGDLFRSKPKKPPQYKDYPEAEVSKLPEPDYQGILLEEAIEKRRSTRNYSKKSITLSQVITVIILRTRDNG
jgi:hypothetical protein